MMEVKNCNLCPRRCGADRNVRLGMCGGGSRIKIARAALHPWEEPCISGTVGSGTVFFSGCPLRCCFCQNYPVSAENFGKEITTNRLAEIFLELQEQGAHNINLVNPTHYVPWVIEAIGIARPNLRIPIVYNSGGYENIQTLRALEGIVNIYLPDLKFADPERANRYTGAPDYFAVACEAILEMYRQTGSIQMEKTGLMRRGVLIRHLVMPKGVKDAIEIFKWVAHHFHEGEVMVSVMSQYTPFYKSGEYAEINRRISTFEYNQVLDCVERLGLKGYMQEKSSAREEYTPPFNLQGV